MDWKIKWRSGCLDEIDLVYEKAGRNDAVAKVLMLLEAEALTEVEMCCRRGGLRQRPVSQVEYEKFSDEERENLIVVLGDVGLTSFEVSFSEPKIIVRLSPEIQRVCSCAAFSILNRLEKVEGSWTEIYPQATLELHVPIGGRKGLARMVVLIAMLHPWLKIVEVSSDVPASTLFQDADAAIKPTGCPAIVAKEDFAYYIDRFAKTGHKDKELLKRIIALFHDNLLSLYFSAELDVSTLSDMKTRIRTVELSGKKTYVPVFTSEAEAERKVNSALIKCSAATYIPMLRKINKPVVINPFGSSPVFLEMEELFDSSDTCLFDETPSVEELTADGFTGHVIDRKYEVMEQTGQNGEEKMYRARDVRFNKTWTVKIWDKREKHYSSVLREMVMETTDMEKTLDHPAIPRVVDICEDKNGIYVVCEPVEGETLERIVSELGAQPTEQVVEWGKQLCGVLGYLHSLQPPHIHRDVKPANIRLTFDGKIKLVDFGIMRTYKFGKAADTCNLGTKGYAAPEQFGGRGQTDARTDIYSLGMTLYRMSTGLEPADWMGKRDVQNDPALHKGLRHIISRCTKANPEERYQTCAELMEDLNNYQNLPREKGILGTLFRKEKR